METSVSKSCPVVGVLVSILLRMVLGAVGGVVHEWYVERKWRRSAVVAVVAVHCAVC